MAKQGMKHYYTKEDKSNAPAVPELSGKAKSGKQRKQHECGAGFHGVKDGGMRASLMKQLGSCRLCYRGKNNQYINGNYHMLST